jgi:hypothetical protein
MTRLTCRASAGVLVALVLMATAAPVAAPKPAGSAA